MGKTSTQPANPPLSVLGPEPVLDVSLEGVKVLRLDQTGGKAPGNKRYKLEHAILRARQLGIQHLVSFGGPWSNHLHALAAMAAQEGMQTTAIVRGETTTPMLEEVQSWGMRIRRVSRSEYRRRNEADYQRTLEQAFKPCLVIPEGGASTEGVVGCVAIGQAIKQHIPEPGRVVVPVGTGTTLAGIAAGVGPAWRVTGISALKGANDLEVRVEDVLEQCGLANIAPWKIEHSYHCGGFARCSRALEEFMRAFESSHEILLDPVYTAKAMYAIFCKIRDGVWTITRPLVMVHTGGLQGRRGFGLGGYE